MSRPNPLLINDECLSVLLRAPENSIDAIVTDPPYGLTVNKRGGAGDASMNTNSPAGRSRITTGGGFMGMKWDSAIPSVEIWQACLRVLRPGGHLLAFAGTRTQHRMIVNIEDAGFEIRDMIAWIYGSGFPKSLNISKAINKTENVDTHQWEGWGTALKPALEPIALARKPFKETVAANVLEHRTGGLNIDECRVSHSSSEDLAESESKNQHTNYANPNSNIDSYSGSMPPRYDYNGSKGRWPANLIHDGSDEVLRLFPQTSPSKPGKRRVGKNGQGWGMTNTGAEYNDTGSAARFFYCAKASKKDRNEGCEDIPESGGEYRPNDPDENTIRQRLNGRRKSGNNHPTVKPTDLMRYLCRLITPPGGLILDPFMGSGSTGKAALLEGFQFIGIELEPEYYEIAIKRTEIIS